MAGIVSIIKGVTSGLAAPVVDYLKQRQEIRSKERIRKEEIKDAQHERNVELIKAGQTADMNWEMEFAKQALTSHKDEFTLGVISIPAVMCFIPKDFSEWQGGAFYVTEGFKALATTPLWYQILFCSMYAATYGIRWWRRSQSDT
jgi:hypothetical protein